MNSEYFELLYTGWVLCGCGLWFVWHSILLKKIYDFIDFRGRQGEGETLKREKHLLAASCTPSAGDGAQKLGMCPDSSLLVHVTMFSQLSHMVQG